MSIIHITSVLILSIIASFPVLGISVVHSSNARLYVPSRFLDYVSKCIFNFLKSYIFPENPGSVEPSLLQGLFPNNTSG
jgi:hypothetical protein